MESLKERIIVWTLVVVVAVVVGVGGTLLKHLIQLWAGLPPYQ